MTSVDDYLAALSPQARDRVEAVRAIVAAELPGLSESISYDIPAFSVAGRVVVYCAGWSTYLSLYPVPDGDAALTADMAPYRAGKGTLRFPHREELPTDLITRVVRALAAAPRMPVGRG